ncbi:hypothetical protein CRV24_000677 [Beauveria bassiana]|nr:hypothetical protein CRV24_000677 [Beauveria bassiana]KAH8720766.1 hypothetical protein HC256_001151 [Beauveria bassiana]
MSHARPPSSMLRTRQACEPCRRKKTKCTAERPTCSFCQRLNVQCVYLPRGLSPASGAGAKIGARKERTNSTSRPGRDTTEGRFQQLELQVTDLYNRLTSLPNAPDSEVIRRGSDGSFLESPTMPANEPPRGHLRSEDGKFTTETPEPSEAALKHFVKVYITQLHHQPLALFNPDRLLHDVMAAPRFLLWSFLSLLLNISSHDFYEGGVDAAKELYAHLAETAVMKLAADGVATHELIQALCLISLKHIQTKQPKRSLVTIGLASRLVSLQALSNISNPTTAEDEASIQCFWNVFALERLFRPLSVAACDDDRLSYPSSAPPPSPISGGFHHPAGHGNSAAGLSIASAQDIGIYGHALCLTEVWGKVRTYLHRLRNGRVEKPWVPESSHAKISIELFENEARYGKQHLLSNVALGKRGASEIAARRDYWQPWMTMQIISHAAQAILNHPFLHLMVLRSQDGIQYSSLFLQQTVDLALFHGAWVFRLLEIADGRLQVVNPLIGDVVAATATVVWLFQFARDPKVSERARNDYARGERFLERMARTWPHISHKSETLKKLQALAEGNHQELTDRSVAINLKPSLFWDLLDPDLLDSHEPARLADADSSLGVGGRDPDARICLQTQYVHPLDEEQDLKQPSNPIDSRTDATAFLPSSEDLEQFYIGDLSHGIFTDDFWTEMGS